MKGERWIPVESLESLVTGHWLHEDLTSDPRQCVVSIESNECAKETVSLDRGRSAPSYANACNEQLFTPEIHRPKRSTGGNNTRQALPRVVDASSDRMNRRIRTPGDDAEESNPHKQPAYQARRFHAVSVKKHPLSSHGLHEQRTRLWLGFSPETPHDSTRVIVRPRRLVPPPHILILHMLCARLSPTIRMVGLFVRPS